MSRPDNAVTGADQEARKSVMGPASRLHRSPSVCVALTVGALSALALTACTSTSHATARALDEAKPQYASRECQQAIRSTEVHEDLYIGRAIATPVLVILTAGAAAPLLIGGNLALGAADRVDASTMSEACGGPGRSAGEIAGDVAGDAALGAVTGAALDGVTGGEGLVSRISGFLFGGGQAGAGK